MKDPARFEDYPLIGLVIVVIILTVSIVSSLIYFSIKSF